MPDDSDDSLRINIGQFGNGGCNSSTSPLIIAQTGASSWTFQAEPGYDWNCVSPPPSRDICTLEANATNIIGTRFDIVMRLKDGETNTGIAQIYYNGTIPGDGDCDQTSAAVGFNINDAVLQWGIYRNGDDSGDDWTHYVDSFRYCEGACDFEDVVPTILPTQPDITDPTNAQDDIDSTQNLNVTADAYDEVHTDGSNSFSHIWSDWQLCSTSDCSGGGNPIQSSYDDESNMTTWTVSSTNMSPSTTYYIRHRKASWVGDANSGADRDQDGTTTATDTDERYDGAWESSSFITVALAGATVYYASSGGSGTDCTSNQPCTFVYACQTKASAGDWIVIQDTISTTVDCSSNDGSSGNEISIIDRKRLTGTITLGDYYDLYCGNSIATLNEGSNDGIYP